MVIVACSFDGEGGIWHLKLDIICWAVRHLSYTFYANNNKNTDYIANNFSFVFSSPELLQKYNIYNSFVSQKTAEHNN